MSIVKPVLVVRVQRSQRLPAESIRSLRQAVVFETLEARRVLTATVGSEALVEPVIDPTLIAVDDVGDENGDEVNTGEVDTGDVDTGDDAVVDTDDAEIFYTCAGPTTGSVDDTDDDEVDEGTSDGAENGDGEDLEIAIQPTASVVVLDGPTLGGTVATFDLAGHSTTGFALSIYLGDADVSSSAAIVDNGDGTASIVLSTPLDVSHSDGAASVLSYDISDGDAGVYGYGSSLVIANAADKGPLLIASLASADDQWVEASDDAQSSLIGSVFDRDTRDIGEYVLTVDWGDGTTSPGTIGDNGDGTLYLAGDHSYANAGTYHVSATLSRADGSATLALATDVAVNETVSDPTDNFPIETFGGGMDGSLSDGVPSVRPAPKPIYRGTSAPTSVIETAAAADAPALPTPTADATGFSFAGPAASIVFSRSKSIASDVFGGTTDDSSDRDKDDETFAIS